MKRKDTAVMTQRAIIMVGPWSSVIVSYSLAEADNLERGGRCLYALAKDVVESQ